ncbi:MAG TPA: hypothetical protein VF142_07475 [Longimicrobium sp.]
MRGMIRTMGAALAALAMAACAANSPGEEPSSRRADQTVRVVVQNDGTIPSQIRVFLVPAGGPEIVVGTMSTLGTETLTARAATISGQYRLRAEGGTRSVLTSPAIQLSSGDVIVWDMRRNVVQRRQ